LETNISTKEEPLTITVIYDNKPFNPDLQTAWGFSALVEYRGNITLFDTGGESPTLLANMQNLGIDPLLIERVILSHNHGDHIGGLNGLLALDITPLVYLLPSFPENVKQHISQKTEVLEISPGQPLAAGVFTTGEMSAGIPEQALIIHSPRGLVVITGCAHPGVVQIIEHAKSMFAEQVYLVMGGFHLGEKKADEIDNILADFRRLGVVKVAPSHCTGDQAITMFEQEYVQDFIHSGVGNVILIETE
jgi:7,8-dihydropterin-6-yl-methyl-4-(beta-D-ribofuranosyl)aminobenzene 5'-phosphate synthase